MKLLKLAGLAVLAVSAPALARAPQCRDSHGHFIHCPTPTAPPASSVPVEDTGYYHSRNGHDVHRPVHANAAPAGASAKCGDGTYSFSQSHRGTCSHHGGVTSWL